jgi:nucleotide-binding universal stress UspA family protein
MALVIAGLSGAGVVALSVEEHLPQYAATVDEVQDTKEQENEYFAKLQTEAAALASEQGIELKTDTVIGHAAQSIVRYAKKHAFDLIAIGHSGHSGVWGVLLGSTTARVVDQAHCDVLVVR